MEKTPITRLSIGELENVVYSLGEPSFRISQLMKWIFQRRVSSFQQMSDMPKGVRAKFEEKYTVGKLAVSSVVVSSAKDAVKFGFCSANSEDIIESVVLFDGKRRTACVSSQLGCALGCVFCETGKMGFIRNLTLDEIIGQLIGINDYLAEHGEKRLVTNIVFMGMGEALLNFGNFIEACRIIMHEDCFNLGGRKITVSTAGVIPSIEKLMSYDLNINLAISLNAYCNEQRSKFMPINLKYPIEELLRISRMYFEKTGRRVTFEYVLIKNVTDTPQAARALASMLKGLVCKVNLISLNPSSYSEYCGVTHKEAIEFSDKLHKLGISATVRASRGRDIFGACGQLSAKTAIIHTTQ